MKVFTGKGMNSHITDRENKFIRVGDKLILESGNIVEVVRCFDGRLRVVHKDTCYGIEPLLSDMASEALIISPVSFTWFWILISGFIDLSVYFEQVTYFKKLKTFLKKWK